jgi:hypothetical protein
VCASDGSARYITAAACVMNGPGVGHSEEENQGSEEVDAHVGLVRKALVK